jgi:hypothetical protein
MRAEEHMRGCERDGSSWREETISELVWQAARPYVMYADFTRREENAVGADWLWWWIDGFGECFGMLVQAKRLHRDGDRWTLNLHANGGEQMKRLFETADLFQVPATYLLYLGTADYRINLKCGPRHKDGCPRCERASVSVMPGLLAPRLDDPRCAAAGALAGSTPLEDLVDPAAQPSTVVTVQLGSIDPQLQRFLLRKQNGARAVARLMVERVCKIRIGQFALAVDDSVDTSLAIFPELPSDRGHFHVPYFPHLLRGLRAELPSYVRDVIAGQLPPESVTDHIGGIVVVRC